MFVYPGIHAKYPIKFCSKNGIYFKNNLTFALTL